MFNLRKLFWKRSRSTDLHALAERMAKVEARLDKLSSDRDFSSPVVIQHADKVVIERAVYSNHFGTLDIESLSGHLNIGVNCRSAADLPEELVPFTKRPDGAKTGAGSAAGSPKPQAGASGSGPACNIRPRNAK